MEESEAEWKGVRLGGSEGGIVEERRAVRKGGWKGGRQCGRERGWVEERECGREGGSVEEREVVWKGVKSLLKTRLFLQLHQCRE